MTPTVCCNCGRRGGQSEGRCIYCLEKDLNWRITQQVHQLLIDALKKE
jgi:hypothetical protein